MQLNILIALDDNKSKTADIIKKSKYLNKLYTTGVLEGAVEIKFNTFHELAKKCRALKIDIVIVENEKWILQGIADVLRKNLVNCLGITSRVNRLILSNSYARELLEKYNIFCPKKLPYPIKYPVYVKADGYCKAGNSLEEIINIRKNIASKSEEIAKTTYIEEYIEGTHCHLISLFDGKNLLSFTQNPELLKYSAKLQTLLNGEKFEFIGFLTSKLIICENKIFNVGFSSDISLPESDFDFIYLLNSAIYQKLNEIKI